MGASYRLLSPKASLSRIEGYNGDEMAKNHIDGKQSVHYLPIYGYSFQLAAASCVRKI